MLSKLSMRILALTLSTSAFAQSEVFSDLYTEGVYLGGAKTTAGLANFRLGVKPISALETYGVVRLGGDTRTFLQKGDAVYNDNMLFVGAGADYMGLIPGIRFTLQTGYTFDLNSKINLKGFDLRTGLIGYDERAWFTPGFVQEIYGEALYIHRYRNFLSNLQWRLMRLWSLPVAGSSLEMGPIVIGAISSDSKGLDYNRFAEFRAGARLRVRDWANLSLQPHYVWGARWGTSEPTYKEWRLLLTAYAAF